MFARTQLNLALWAKNQEVVLGTSEGNARKMRREMSVEKKKMKRKEVRTQQWMIARKQMKNDDNEMDTMDKHTKENAERIRENKKKKSRNHK